MQPDPYRDDPFYSQPTEINPQAAPPQQDPAYNAPPTYNPNNPYAEQRPPPTYRDQEKASAVYGIAKLIDYLKWALLVLEVIFTLRFLLKLLGADPANPFASFMYGLSGFFLAPFSGLVRDPTFGVTAFHVFEWTTLIGMLVYALAFWIVWLLLRTTISRPREPIS